VEERDRRGNSLLVVGAPDTSTFRSELPPLSSLATALDGGWQPYAEFGDAVDAAHRFLGDYVRSRCAAGVRIAGYGASARAISTLSLAGLTREHIRCVCDANPNLHGLFLPKSRIPIVPLRELLASEVEEIIVFAYGYMAEIRAALDPLVRRGVKALSLLDILAGRPRPIN
jgi:hypothetical protein